MPWLTFTSVGGLAASGPLTSTLISSAWQHGRRWKEENYLRAKMQLHPSALLAVVSTTGAKVGAFRSRQGDIDIGSKWHVREPRDR